VDIKVKSLDRKAGEARPSVSKPAKTAKPEAAPAPEPESGTKSRKRRKKQAKKAAENKQLQTVAQPLETEPPKSLPAIPRQLISDFHPHHELEEEHHHFSVTGWSIGSIVLMIVFLGQTVYFKHNDLVRVPQLAPYVETFCRYLSCEMSLPSDVRQLELLSQDIRSHPKKDNALLVNTTIINNAGFVQSLPGLQITFSDLNGRKVAMRRFKPNEYMPPGTPLDTGIQPDTPVQIKLEMIDPGSNAVNFEFDFVPLS
jgi:hypothetical protein